MIDFSWPQWRRPRTAVAAVAVACGVAVAAALTAQVGSAVHTKVVADAVPQSGTAAFGTVLAVPNNPDAQDFKNQAERAYTAYFQECYTSAGFCPLPTEVYQLPVAQAAAQAGIDPRLLMAIMLNERGIHFYKPGLPWVAHTYSGEMARLAAVKTKLDHSLGIVNIQEPTFGQAQAYAGQTSDLAGHQWSDIVGDPKLAIEAAAWKLAELKSELGTSWASSYTQNQLLAIGYNAGDGVMKAVAGIDGKPAMTPAQVGTHDDGTKDHTWYVDQVTQNWNTVDAVYCRSVLFTCVTVKPGDVNGAVTAGSNNGASSDFGPDTPGAHIAAAFTANGGQQSFGTPADNGGGSYTHQLGDVWVQDFAGGTFGPSVIVDGPKGTFFLDQGFRTAYLNADTAKTCGAPVDNAHDDAGGTRQDFTGCSMTWTPADGVTVHNSTTS